MISRRYIRTKTMQALYAHSLKPFESVTQAQHDLIFTVKNCYTLFLWLFSILPEVAFYRANKLEDLKGKNNPTPEDLHPNLKFVDNEVIRQIEENVTLKNYSPNIISTGPKTPTLSSISSTPSKNSMNTRPI